MGKVKIKRKSTLIDMTAMSDVTVLLLTFFMLTSTFLQKEPVTVITPSSVSEIKVPVSNLATVLVSPKGKVFISILGDADPELKESLGSEALRQSICRKAVSIWNAQHPSQQVQLNENQLVTFSKLNMFGVPFQKLSEFLSMSQAEQDRYMQNLDSNGVGIPVDDNRDLSRLNQFQIWLEAIRDVEDGSAFHSAIRKGEGITVKADRGTSYQVVHNVLDNLQTMKMNRFTIMTALKTAED